MSAIASKPRAVDRPSWLASRPRPLLWGTLLVLGPLLAGALAVYSPRYAIGLVGGGAVIIGVLMWPLFGACLLVGLVPATSGLISGFPLPNLRLSEAVIGVVGVTLIATARRRDAVAWKQLDWLLLIYGVCWAVFGAFANFNLHQGLSISEWGTVFGQLQFFLVYRGVRVAIRSARDREIALGVCILATIPVSLLAIFQQLNTFGARALIQTMTGGISGKYSVVGSLMGSTTSIRATGPFNNWAALAGYLFPILLVMIAIGLTGVRPKHRNLFVATGVLAAIALAMTDEQSIIICLVVGLVLMVKRSPRAERLRRWMGIGGAVVAVVVSPLLIERIANELSGSAGTNRVSWIPQTLQFRWTVWTGQYLPAITSHLAVGYGVVYPSSITWLAPESQYIACLMEGGIPMLIVFIALAWGMFTAVRAGITSPLNDPLQQAMCQALLITVVAMIVVNFIWQFLSNGGMPQVLWALLALAIPTERPAGGGARATFSLDDRPVGMVHR